MHVRRLRDSTTIRCGCYGLLAVGLLVIVLTAPSARAAPASLDGHDRGGEDIAGRTRARTPDEPRLVAPENGATEVSTDATLTVHVSDPGSDVLDVTFLGRPAGGAPPEDFTVVHVGDTQHYSASHPATLTRITQWIRDHQAEFNIVYVAASGDIVNTAAILAEWERADAAYSILEPPILPDLLDGVPYGVVPGNHDQSPNGEPNGTQQFNQYFGIERFLGRSYYGGSLNGIDNDNNFTLFSAAGMDFISVNLEYDTTPDLAVLSWADTVLQAYSDRRAILVTHYAIEVGEQSPFGTQGQAIYDAVMNNPNVFLLLCGHRHGEGRRQDSGGVSTIHTLMANFQDYPNGGNGWIRLLRFSPANDAIQVRTFSPWLTQKACTHAWVPAGGGIPEGCYQQDADSEFVIPYPMAGTPFTVLGTNPSVASNSDTSWAWSGLSSGVTYEWHVTASVGAQTTRSPTWRFTTTCSSPGGCDDGNPCSIDTCEAQGCVHRLDDGAACDDGNPCTTGDTCAGGACAGFPVTAVEVARLSVAAAPETTMIWTGLGAEWGYDLASGTLTGLHAGSGTTGAECLLNDLVDTTAVDVRANPSHGEGFYYLVRGQHACGVGTYGASSVGTERVPASDCSP